MKRIILILSLLVIALIPCSIVLAANTDNALWIGTVRVTNNSTSDKTNESAVISSMMTTEYMIANGYIDSDVGDAVVQLNGTDVPFMPGYGTNPWVVFIDEISAKNSVDYTLYSSNVTGSIKYYFPGSGIAVTDNASIKPGAEFTAALRGYIDTANAASKTLIKKEREVDSFVSANVTGNITGTLLGAGDIAQDYYYADFTSSAWTTDDLPITQGLSEFKIRFYNSDGAANRLLSFRELQLWNGSSWVSPISASGAGWSNTSFIYDNNIATWADYMIPISSWSSYVSIIVPAYYEYSYIKYYIDRSSLNINIMDADIYPTPTATITGVTTDEATFQIHYDGSNFWLTADTATAHYGSANVTTTNLTAAGGAPAHNYPWQFGSQSATPYIEYASITKGGLQKGFWNWEYNAGYFTDDSGNGNTANVTSRTTTTDADVYASLLDFMPISEAKAEDFSLSGLDDVLTGTVSIPQMYGELDFTNFYPGEAVNDVLTEADVPEALWWFPLVFLGTAIIGLITYGATTLSVSGGQVSYSGAQSGSLILMVVVMEALIAVPGIMGIIPYWPAILFLIPSAAIIVSTRATW